jgi:type II secretory pathway predicted ATPase ExeA
LLYTAENRRGVAMLTGDVGCGKSTVIQALVASLSKEEYQIKIVSNPALTPLDLIKAILLQLGEKAMDNSKTILLDRLMNRLLKDDGQGIRTVLAIDEAHVIAEQSTLDELRMLLNMQHNGRFLLTIILLGQPPLLKNISELQPLKERIGMKFDLDPLDFNNTLNYMVYRLKAAGAKRGIFGKEAIPEIFNYSKGIPLRINNLCDRCLLIGMLKKARYITAAIVEEAIEDLQ